MRHFGIIGNPLKQSFSAKYFTEKFKREGIDAEYSLYPLADIDGCVNVMAHLSGMNVTIPYKIAILPYLSELDETAEAIGAVNVVRCVLQTDGRVYTKGYNTDCIGFMNSIRPLLQEHHKSALVLGTGGAAKAVRFGLEKMGIKVTNVTRKEVSEENKGKWINYRDLTKDIVQNHKVIVNCTPLGMWPETEAYAQIPYEEIDSEHLLYDCIYNPEKTIFLRRGEEHGATIANGLGMLYGQAEAAWEIWNNK